MFSHWKWRNDRRSKRNLCNCVKKPEKNSGLQRGLNPWPRDTGAMLYQLSYEAIDVGSRSVVGSYVPVKEMSVNDIWNKSYMNCGNEMKMKKWSSQWTQFMQLRKEAWKKFRTSTGFEPVTSRYRCDALPTELWSHWRWEQVTLSTRSSIHACTWIIDSTDHESFVIMSWYGSTRHVPWQNKG